jgi:hypothetical protein
MFFVGDFKGTQDKEIQRFEKQYNEFVFEPKQVIGIDLGGVTWQISSIIRGLNLCLLRAQG